MSWHTPSDVALARAHVAEALAHVKKYPRGAQDKVGLWTAAEYCKVHGGSHPRRRAHNRCVDRFARWGPHAHLIYRGEVESIWVYDPEWAHCCEVCGWERAK